MQKSDNIGELVDALCRAKRNFKPLIKDKKGAHGKYIDLATLIEGTQDALCNEGLSIMQTSIPETDCVTVETLLAHKSGQWISSSMRLPITNRNPNVSQNYGAAISYARRYQYTSILCIQGDEDNDAEFTTQNGPHAMRSAPAKVAPPPKVVAKEDKEIDFGPAPVNPKNRGPFSTFPGTEQNIEMPVITLKEISRLLKDGSLTQEDVDQFKKETGSVQFTDIPIEKHILLINRIKKRPTL